MTHERGLEGYKDKEKDKDIYMDKDRDKEKDKEKASKPKKRKKFKKPTLEELTEYCSKRGNTIDAERFISHYESKGWMIGKNKMVDWKSAVVTWEKNAVTQNQGKRKVYIEPEHKIKNRGW